MFKIDQRWPYGKKLEVIEDNDDGEELERITISIPRSMKYALDDLMLDRKRNKKPVRTTSAMIREALKVYLKKYEVWIHISYFYLANSQ